MSFHAVNIQGINITKSSKKEILKDLEKLFSDGMWDGEKWSKNGPKILRIVTPNPEQIVLAQNNREFANMLNQADLALPDGVGLVWASRFLAKSKKQQLSDALSSTIPGLDFMEDLVAIAEDRHVPIVLIGGASGVAVKALECLRQKHTDLLGVAIDAPQFTIGSSGLAMNDSIEEYFDTLAAELKMKKIGMVFVALGAPKQEYFIEQLSLSLRVRSDGDAISQDIRLPRHFVSRNDKGVILMSVGGSFDEISGRIPRAPRWVSTIGLKWLWRLTLEPWRIKRQVALIHFVWFVLKERYLLK